MVSGKAPFNNRAFHAWILLVTALAVAMVWTSMKGWTIEKDILSSLPSAVDDAGFKEAASLYEKRMSRKVVFAFTAADWPTQVRAAEEFMDYVKECGCLSKVQAGLDSDERSKWIGMLYPYRQQLLTSEQLKLIDSGGAQQLQAQALMNLYSPVGTSSSLAQDPLNLMASYYTQGGAGLSVVDGYLQASKSGKPSLLILGELSEAGNDFLLQKKIAKDLTGLVSSLESKYSLQIWRTGSVFFMTHAVNQAYSEISTIGLGSLLGITLLFLFLFRSAQPFLVSLSVILLSIAAAIWATHQVFGLIHLFTLVLGVSVLGLVIDYLLHFFAQRFNAKVASGQESKSKIMQPLSFSLLSTVVGFSGLWWTGFPALQQLSVFAVVGLGMAFLSILAIGPLLPHRQLTVNPWLRKLSEHTRLWRSMPFARVWTVVGALVVLAVLLIVQVSPNDDVRILQDRPEDLGKQDLQIKDLLDVKQGGTSFVLVRAPSQQDLLVGEEILLSSIEDRLAGAKVSAISLKIPSLKRQTKSFQSYQQLKPAIAGLYSQLKIPQGKVSGWMSDQSLQFSPLSVGAGLGLLQSLPLVDQWLGELRSQFYSVVRLDGKVVEVPAGGVNTAEWRTFDRVAQVSSLFSQVRESVSLVLAIAIVVVLALLSWLWSVRQAMAVVIPPAVSGALALGLGGIAFGYINLFHWLAVVLVFFLGLDYAIFYSKKGRDDYLSTWVAVSASSITTILSFGLLALSDTAAIASFGLTIVFGIIGCYLLAPMAMRIADA